jgi:hypothetical protein
MREILFAGKETQECPTLKRDVVADRPAQHGIPRLERIKNGLLGDWRRDLELYFTAHMRQRTEMVGKNDSDHKFPLVDSAAIKERLLPN